jgi:hypothetical protein
MSWLKNVLVDLLVTAIIVVYVFTGAVWAYWIIAIYTPLILLLKIGAVATGVTKKVKKSPDAAPVWFYHLLYGVCLLLLLYVNWWLVAAGWAAIWVLSAVHESRMSAAK